MEPNADGTGSREIQVVPVENEYSLRNRDWVEKNPPKEPVRPPYLVKVRKVESL